MRIALFGGSFNPPHLAHQLACTVVLATARPRVDAVWMMPTFRHPFEKRLAPFEDRVAMCERAARVFGGRVAVSRIEEELGGESYTLHTVRTLKTRHPEDELALVIGADLLEERTRWHGWPELERIISFLVVGRAGSALAGDSAGRFELPRVSSTEVRARLARGEPVEDCVDAEVLDYIRDHDLYRPGA